MYGSATHRCRIHYLCGAYSQVNQAKARVEQHWKFQGHVTGDGKPTDYSRRAMVSRQGQYT